MDRIAHRLGWLAIVAAGCQASVKVAPPPPPPPPEPAKPVVEKEAEADLVFPEEEFRSTEPQGGPQRPFQLPAMKAFDLGKVKVYLVERHELPTVMSDLRVEGGERNDPRGREGLASVCMGMMTEGTKKLDKNAFDEAVGDLGSHIGAYAGREDQGVWMSALTKRLDETLALYFDTIVEPGFRQVDFDRMIKRSLESLKQQKASPGSVAQRLYETVHYGARHAFGGVTTEDSLGAIDLEDCEKLHRSTMKPKGAELYVVGDLTEAQVRERFAPLFERWQGKPRRAKRVGKPKPRRGTIFFVQIPNAEQASIYVMQTGPERTAKDYFANQLMVSVLGGSFSSRINMNLREGKGYSYGARATFTYTKKYGMLLAYSSVRIDSAHQSVLEVLNEIAGLKGKSEAPKPATAGELEREKNGEILGLPARFETAQRALASYRELVYYGLPLDYYDTYADRVGAVTLDQVAASADKHLKPAKVKVLVVSDGSAEQIRHENGKDVPLVDEGGKPVTLLGALEGLAKSGKLGKGKLVILDADGRVVRGE